jgi:hypothetical protein
MEDNLQPVLLFKVREKAGRKTALRNVYSFPQRGVGMDGFISDGSVLSVARHIANGRFTTILGEAIAPKDTSEQTISTCIQEWIREEK